MNVGILLLRVAVGLTLAAHGGQKLFGWFGGHGLAGTGTWLESAGFKPGRRHALMAGLVEFGAGLLLAFGLLTPLAAALVASVMLVAARVAHASKGFFLTNGGYEYNLVLGVAGLVIAFTGPGAVSIDSLLGIDVQGVVPGLGAAIVGLVGAVLQLAGRRTETPVQTRAAA